MNFAHIHLVMTHFPPVLSLGGAVAAAAGVLLKRGDLVRLALVLLIAVGAMMPLVYLAGNRAADLIGRVDGVQQEAIAPHQRAALIALVGSICGAFIAGALLIIQRRRDSMPPSFSLLALMTSIACATVIGWVAALGGAIHHPEIHL